MASALDIERTDRPAYVRFERVAVEDFATLAAGHYVAKDVDYALITPPYSKDIMKYKVVQWFEQLKQDIVNNRIPDTWVDSSRNIGNAAISGGQHGFNFSANKACQYWRIAFR